jgi:ATP phosphoribosyltransferase regulatory subunit
VLIAIQDLVNINANLSAVDVKVVIDLGELKAYEYHTGVVFCAYNEDYSKALAQGGRYNGLSASFGRPRGVNIYQILDGCFCLRYIFKYT